MAIDYRKAAGNKTLLKTSETNNELLNSTVILNIDLTQIDENPDNRRIFNMEKIEELSRSIERDGFTGAIEVIEKPDGRYEISAGHRRYAAMQLLGKKTIPCIISKNVDAIARARKLLSSNIHNRVMTPMDYAKSIDYYCKHVLVPEKGKASEKDIMDFFGISRPTLYRYKKLMDLIPELQEVANNPDFPHTALASAAGMNNKQQKELYEEIIAFHTKAPDYEITKTWVEQIINRIKGKATPKPISNPTPTEHQPQFVMEDIQPAAPNIIPPQTEPQVAPVSILENQRADSKNEEDVQKIKSPHTPRINNYIEQLPQFYQQKPSNSDLFIRLMDNVNQNLSAMLDYEYDEQIAEQVNKGLEEITLKIEKIKMKNNL